ncbi:MarR family transcriptional regulator, 2-MHQ and catechol-resistance regulon repressor [Halobacillus karajensis]|uniref:HTH-type transcriptional regulator MhqR n=1 Tax=Halobacillus karajensis TaxID=195088 RepID=A0A024PAJ4_9BACI|nr:MarR family transcriptional regulator [Halobacillus karajensis]CDQ21517.1 HTH-type transcriptional regulator MhqR [Halobacillus karajensis]CDQ25452.1 HTH-type transcriptional regulator MhqR [Halobacillus karajensis]CDQ29017.1 HTH-type transcriptional regulator MhqR [Halobacillus karajensis]SEI09330.1 MarR family transcriptional regulator, 2-MHQ and catechol-resistance regulon repressor [Halobacillus karajensis]
MNEQELYRKKKQDPSLKLFVVLTKAQRTIADLVKDDIQRYELNPTEFGVLELLYHQGDQPLQKIGEKILLASGSITYVVDKLEKKEYLKRVPCPNDRRITFASITDKGRELLNDIFPDHWKQIEAIMDGLSEEEKKDAIELLKKLGTYADSISG